MLRKINFIDKWFRQKQTIDILLMINDDLNKRNVHLTDGIHKALWSIPNNIYKDPTVTILENTLYDRD